MVALTLGYARCSTDHLDLIYTNESFISKNRRCKSRAPKRSALQQKALVEMHAARKDADDEIAEIVDVDRATVNGTIRLNQQSVVS